MTDICRTCLAEIPEDEGICIFRNLIHEVTILQVICTIAPIKEEENDLLPQCVCKLCFAKLERSYVFTKLIVSSYEKLIENHTNIKIESETIANIKLEYEDDSYDDIHNKEIIEPTDLHEFNTRKEIKLESPDILEQKNICVHCDKEFKTSGILKRHTIQKHSEWKFKCETCNKKCATRYHLNRHLRVHTKDDLGPYKRKQIKERKFKCLECEHLFMTKELLTIHLRQVHTGERPFLCELCSKAYSSQTTLRYHKLDVHTQRIPCPTCKKSYTMRILKRHMQRHKDREEGIKRYSCDICFKRFTSETGRKLHQVLHTGEKPFICDICKKGFTQKSILRDHIETHSKIRI